MKIVSVLVFVTVAISGKLLTKVHAFVDFLVTSRSSDPNNKEYYFVSRIVQEQSIADARAELSKTSGFRIISGTISKTPVEWNPGWSFHLIPETVFFGDFFIEVCDANVVYVEDNLDDAGGAFLPNLKWCPWGTRVLLDLNATNGDVTVNVTEPPKQTKPPKPVVTPTFPPTAVIITGAPTMATDSPTSILSTSTDSPTPAIVTDAPTMATESPTSTVSTTQPSQVNITEEPTPVGSYENSTKANNTSESPTVTNITDVPTTPANNTESPTATAVPTFVTEMDPFSQGIAESSGGSTNLENLGFADASIHILSLVIACLIFY